MDTWQAWATVIVSIVVTILMFNYKRDKNKADKESDDLARFKLSMTERIVRIEAEIMTEREVREVLQDFFQPFLSSITELNTKTEAIQRDITSVKVALASQRRRTDDD